MTMSSVQQQPSPMESSGGGSSSCPHDDADAPVVSSNSKKKLWRGMQAVYLVLVKKHQPKLEALGVHLHRLLSRSKRLDRDRRRRSSSLAGDYQNPALMYLSSSLSCRSMDPSAAVVHPYPRGGHGHGGHRRASSSSSRHAHAASPPSSSSLSCRSMDPAAAVCRYQYRPREVEFSCKSTPMHRRRRENKRRLRLQQSRAADDPSESESERAHYYGSAAAVTTLFALMDVEEEAADEEVDGDLDLDYLDAAAATWPTTLAAPRQVRITDSPYLVAREEENSEEMRSAVDRRADEFIMWFHEQLRTQQKQQQRSSTLYTQIR